MTRDEMIASLHGMETPEPVGLWPLAPGWWALLLGLLGLAVGLAVAGAWLYRRRHRRRALRALRELERRPPTSDAERARELAALNGLLREVALTLAPARAVAGRSGLAWLHFLDNTLEDGAFSRGPGRCLADGPYRPAVAAEEVDREALFGLARRWLRRARREGG